MIAVCRKAPDGLMWQNNDGRVPHRMSYRCPGFSPWAENWESNENSAPSQADERIAASDNLVIAAMSYCSTAKVAISVITHLIWEFGHTLMIDGTAG